ncbi:hypothetical protein B296_00026694 [Ensete ventricosum]|uniref:Uncharacterized protein n=1 Tax=Ensete ventricosum TaxID=4639 RepID=A0A427A007_ENSVE|nr:hypothetical protein B296_00026694 [Ensete ventricosum]
MEENPRKSVRGGVCVLQHPMRQGRGVSYDGYDEGAGVLVCNIEWYHSCRAWLKRPAAFGDEGDSSTPFLDLDQAPPPLDDLDPIEELKAQG